MSAHVLLKLLNEVGKSDKMRGLPSVLSFVLQREFNKLNNTGAQMLDSIYHRTLRSLRIGMRHNVRNVVMDVIS